MRKDALLEIIMMQGPSQYDVLVWIMKRNHPLYDERKCAIDVRRLRDDKLVNTKKIKKLGGEPGNRQIVKVNVVWAR